MLRQHKNQLQWVLCMQLWPNCGESLTESMEFLTNSPFCKDAKGWDDTDGTELHLSEINCA